MDIILWCGCLIFFLIGSILDRFEYDLPPGYRKSTLFKLAGGILWILAVVAFLNLTKERL